MQISKFFPRDPCMIKWTRVWISLSVERLLMTTKKFTRRFGEQKTATRNICEGESFYFCFIQRLVYFFSGWKFSSSSLLKILWAFGSNCFSFTHNGNCLLNALNTSRFVSKLLFCQKAGLWWQVAVLIAAITGMIDNQLCEVSCGLLCKHQTHFLLIGT